MQRSLTKVYLQRRYSRKEKRNEKAFLKKVMAVAVVGAMTMGLVACGNGNSGNVSESTQNQENSVSGEEKETNAEGYLVGYSLNSMDSTMKQMADYLKMLPWREDGPRFCRMQTVMYPQN